MCVFENIFILFPSGCLDEDGRGRRVDHGLATVTAVLPRGAIIDVPPSRRGHRCHWLAEVAVALAAVH